MRGVYRVWIRIWFNSRTCNDGWTSTTLQTDNLLAFNPVIITSGADFYLALAEHWNVLMKVADMLKLMQLMPQVFKLADDIIWPSPKKTKSPVQSRRSPGLSLISHMCRIYCTRTFQQSVAENFQILSTGWLNKLPGINSVMWWTLPLTALMDNVAHLHQALPP